MAYYKIAEPKLPRPYLWGESSRASNLDVFHNNFLRPIAFTNSPSTDMQSNLLIIESQRRHTMLLCESRRIHSLGEHLPILLSCRPQSSQRSSNKNCRIRLNIYYAQPQRKPVIHQLRTKKNIPQRPISFKRRFWNRFIWVT